MAMWAPIIPMAEAIRKLTSLPAANLGVRDRGLLNIGNFADGTVHKLQFDDQGKVRFCVVGSTVN